MVQNISTAAPLRRDHALRVRLMASGAMLGLAFAVVPATARAQQPGQEPPQLAALTPPPTPDAVIDGEPAPPQDDEEGKADIVVTGSRVARDGYSAPTPVNVVSEKEIKTEAPANITDFVNTLPAVRGSSTAANSNGSLSNGLAGVASVNLRSLGAQRTLVLFDGQRSVASATSGVVDVNTFPQALIERIEIVTGGASSAYGSDAVSGVINFILNKKYTGIKADYEYGVTTYGDGENHKATLTGGFSFAGGRGHILVSGEYFKQSQIPTIARDWNNAGFFQIDNPAYNAAFCTDNNPATVCAPARLIQGGIGTSQFTPGGLVSTGPLRGLYFGVLNPATGRATTNNLVFGPTNGQWMVGGDYLITRQGHIGSASLLPGEVRGSGFGRISYEFSPAFELYGQFAYTQYTGQSFYQQTPTTGVVIQRDNAYLPASTVAAMQAANLTSIQIGTSNAGIPPQGSDNTREVYRYVVGADGGFSAIGADWKWDAYYQRGITKTAELLTNAWNINRLALATDAVVAPAGNAAGIAAGTIVCRSRLTLANVNNGCVPINRIGIGGVTPEALNYIFNGGNQPLRNQTLTQDVAALNFSTNNLFNNWAGPVSLAFGGEYRREAVTGTVDPQFNTGWIYGNYLVTAGNYTVAEGFIETVFPLFKGADFNGAFRFTDYSTSGSVTTWKAGLTYQIIDDLKIRGTYSRDIRAPNLGELFAPGTARTNTVNVPLAGGAQRADQFTEATVGNTQLAPEIAKTWGVGVVVTPRFLPGFAMSLDYFNIALGGAINTLTAQTTVQLCYEQANAAACNNITTTGGRGVTTAGLVITGIELKPINFVTIESQGIDFEMSYRRPLFAGNISLRGLVTKNISLYTNNGIDFPTQAVGQNSGNVPAWTYRATVGYDVGPWGFQLVGRGLSGGVYDNSYIVCDTNCPVSTVQNRTVNTNSIPGAFYLDLQANHSFTVGRAKAQAFLSIRNLFDEDPVLVGNGPTGNNTPAYPQTNRNLYDVLGRVFRIGVRIAY